MQNIVCFFFSLSLFFFFSTGTVILACVWPESGKPVCSVEDGFSFNYKITDRLTLEIPSATEKVAGVYACSRVPTDNIPVRPCSLIVEGDFFSSFLLLRYQPSRDNLLISFKYIRSLKKKKKKQEND